MMPTRMVESQTVPPAIDSFGQELRISDRSWIELSAPALLHNLKVFRQVLDGAGHQSTKMGSVLKGNAYGHGLDAMARLCCLPQISDFISVFYVFSVDEALELSAALRVQSEECTVEHENLRTVCPRILVLGAHPVQLARMSHATEFEWVISSFFQIEELSRDCIALGNLKSTLKVHFHIDSGLGREGFTESDCGAAATALLSLPMVEIVGCMTHFSNTEDVTKQDYALKQIATFARGFAEVQKIVVHDLEKHLAASAATLVLEPSHADIVRIGIGTYGLWPSNETRLSFIMAHEKKRITSQIEKMVELHPVLSWRVASMCVKKLAPGQFVGYGCSFRCSIETTVAVFPVGYFDGYSRSLTSHAHVLVGGKRCSVIGRVMMNHIVVDVSHCSVAVNSKECLVATLIGRDGDECISADDLASWSGTICYEAVTRINAGLERVITGVDERFRLRSSE